MAKCIVKRTTKYVLLFRRYVVFTIIYFIFFRNNLASSATTVNGILLERSFRQVKTIFTPLVRVVQNAATFLVTVKRCTFKGLPFGIQGVDQALEKSWKWTASLKIR